MKKRKTQPTQSANLQNRVEEFLKNPAVIKDMPPEDVRILFEDLKSHQIELENRNDELLKANRKLQESEKRFRNFLDNLGDAAYETDTFGNVTYANKMAELITGLLLEDIIGKPFLPLFIEESQKKAMDVYQQTLNGESPEYELTFTNQRSCHFKNKPLLDKDGNIVGVFGTARDVTERKQVEKALKQTRDELEQRVEERTAELLKINESLKESEERFRKLAEGSFEAIVLHEEGVILDANNQYYEMFGYNPEELAAKDAISLTATPESVESIKKQIFSGNFGPYEVTGVKKDGTKFPMEIRIKSTSYKGHKVRIGVIRDLTEQKQAEKALRESEARFRDTATMLPSVIIEYGLDGILTYVNPHGYKLAGYNSEDFEKGFHVLQLAAPEEHEKHYERIQRMMQGEKLPPTEYCLLRKDGSTFWGLVTSSLIYKDGEVVGVRTYTIDISERKKAEEILKERTRELELKTNSLEEVNTAMKVLLKKREEDKEELGNNVLTNVKELIAPYFKKIKKTKLDDQQKTFLSIIESNLNEIISPFTRKMSLEYLSLTPTEIQIANLIRHGNPTKNIAKLMNVSPRTIDTHRKNIRRKLGLHGQKGNLRSHLLSLQ